MTLCAGLHGWAGTRKVKSNLDFTEAKDSEWQWHQLGYMQICTSLQTNNNHTSTPPLSFLQAVCPSCTRKCIRIKQTHKNTARNLSSHMTCSRTPKAAAHNCGNHATLNACRVNAIEYTCTKFGVDSSSSFPFRAWTHTDTRSHRCHWSSYPLYQLLPVWDNDKSLIYNSPAPQQQFNKLHCLTSRDSRLAH